MSTIPKTVKVVEENNIIQVQDGTDIVKVIDTTEVINFNDVTDTLNFRMRDVIVVNNGGTGSTDPTFRRNFDFIDHLNVLVGIAPENATDGDNLWKIYRIERGDVDGVDCIYADGTELFDKRWNDRLTYTY